MKAFSLATNYRTGTDMRLPHVLIVNGASPALHNRWEDARLSKIMGHQSNESSEPQLRATTILRFEHGGGKNGRLARLPPVVKSGTRGRARRERTNTPIRPLFSDLLSKQGPLSGFRVILGNYFLKLKAPLSARPAHCRKAESVSGRF